MRVGKRWAEEKVSWASPSLQASAKLGCGTTAPAAGTHGLNHLQGGVMLLRPRERIAPAGGLLEPSSSRNCTVWPPLLLTLAWAGFTALLSTGAVRGTSFPINLGLAFY